MVEPSRHLNGFRFRLSIAFGRWAHARPSTKCFVFGGSVNCVRTFSWGAAAPQTPRDDGLNLARPSAKIAENEAFGRWARRRPSTKRNRRTNESKSFPPPHPH